MSLDAVDINLVLVSHTNNGKTTLTRTLLGADVGEVRDAAHVTQTSEVHTLLASAIGDRLRLWDTPGFGDSVRLLKRLGNADNPIGWFLREVLDRYRDRPFWLSQQALRTARDTCDVVLYLVNASERPEDAGYVEAEMKILAWLDRPVLVLLNQVGPPQPEAQEKLETKRWRLALEPYALVANVLPLDAFARCWVHERVFYQALGPMVSTEKLTAHARLLAAWDVTNLERFTEAMELITHHLSAATIAKETIVSPQKPTLKSFFRNLTANKRNKDRLNDDFAAEVGSDDGDTAMHQLLEQLDRDIAKTTVALLALYRIDPGAASKINARVRDNFAIRAPIDKTQAGLLGALISGATTGLTADLVAGGLTAGLGAVLGGVAGALTFASAAWGFNATTDREVPTVQFAPALLRTLTATSVLRYLAIIHFGRGRGNFIEGETPAFWQERVEHAIVDNERALFAAWQLLHKEGTEGTNGRGSIALYESVTAITATVLESLYPEGADAVLLRLRADFPAYK